MILNRNSIFSYNIMSPFWPRTKHPTGLSYGCGVASYDVCLGEDVHVTEEKCTLGVTAEHFNMPTNVCGFVKDKSSWARAGLSVFNTFIDPGWRGYLTLEFSYKSCDKDNSAFINQFVGAMVPSMASEKQLELFHALSTTSPGGYVSWSGDIKELKFIPLSGLFIPAGTPICQIIFMYTEETEGYTGKYQDQGAKAINTLMAN